MFTIEEYLIALHSYCVHSDLYFRNPDRFIASFNESANESALADFKSIINRGMYFGSDMSTSERFSKLKMIASLRYQCLEGRVDIGADHSFGEGAIASYRHGGVLFSARTV